MVKGEMGRVLAAYLIEHLPFETEPEKMIQTVRRVLQPGLTESGVRLDLWKKGLRKGAYHVGFILTIPDDLPIEAEAHALFAEIGPRLLEFAGKGNPAAGVLHKILSEKGQSFLEALKIIMKKPSNQEVVNEALDAVRFYLSAIRPEGDPNQTFEELREEAEVFIQNHDGARDLLAMHEEMPRLLKSLRVLSGMGYGVLRPVFHDTTAIGSLMRRKLEPVFKQLHEEIDVLSKK